MVTLRSLTISEEGFVSQYLSNYFACCFRILQERNALQDLQSEIQTLKQELGSGLATEESLKKELAQVMDEKQLLKQELLSANSSLEETKRELETRINA